MIKYRKYGGETEVTVLDYYGYNGHRSRKLNIEKMNSEAVVTYTVHSCRF